MKTYAVFVSNPNGWENDCPSFNDVFFGCSFDYLHPVDGGIGRCGHVAVVGLLKAVELRDKLNSTGDWKNPETGETDQPQYSIVPLNN